MDQGTDSYTGVPIQKYESKIPNIQRGRSPFYKEAELRRISAQYYIGPSDEGAVAQPSPHEGAWYLRRLGCPAEFFPALRSSVVAQVVMDWCVRNDASIRVAIYWLGQGDIQPYFNMLDRIAELSNDTE